MTLRPSRREISLAELDRLDRQAIASFDPGVHVAMVSSNMVVNSAYDDWNIFVQCPAAADAWFNACRDSMRKLISAACAASACWPPLTAVVSLMQAHASLSPGAELAYRSRVALHSYVSGGTTCRLFCVRSYAGQAGSKSSFSGGADQVCQCTVKNSSLTDLNQVAALSQ